jgi:hypothetical protein
MGSPISTSNGLWNGPPAANGWSNGFAGMNMTEKPYRSISDPPGDHELEKPVHTEFHIPEKAPRIGVQGVDNPPSETVRVTLGGDPFHFGAFDAGDEFVVCDYDLPDENLTQVSRGYTLGPVLFQGQTCTEIVTHEHDARGQPLQLVRRLVTRGTRFAKIMLISLRRPDGMGSVEITGLEFPLALEPRIRWQVVRAAGTQQKAEPESNTERITGVVDVFVGKQSFRCLRWLRPRTTGMGYRAAEEIFVDIESSMTVLIRGFVGSDYPKIDQFQRSPQLEIAGEIFYLRYIRRVLRHRKGQPPPLSVRNSGNSDHNDVV